jgi:transglutaminase-like putative cysteine protease
MRFTIAHETRYHFSQPVELHPHRAMLRPRDGHHLRIINATLSLSPNAPVIWSFDVFGNSICTIAFEGMAHDVAITSTLELERFPAPPELLVVNGHPVPYPVLYSPENRRDLASLMLLDDEQAIASLETWIDTRGLRQADNALTLARNLMTAVHQSFTYETRYDEGTLRPTDMLAHGGGTCRDYAFFMMETARIRGFAARFATGYLYSPALDSGEVARQGAAAPHAWCELFIPTIGWVDFDPTNNLTGTADLIKVASVRKPSQAIPIAGSYTGPTGVGGPPDVTVKVTRQPPL